MADVIDIFLVRQEMKRRADDALISSVLCGSGADVADVATTFYEALEAVDDEARFLCLLQLLADADDQGRAQINNILQILCGWSLPDLVRLAAGQPVAAEKWAPGED